MFPFSNWFERFNWFESGFLSSIIWSSFSWVFSEMFSATIRVKCHSFGRFIAIGLKGRTENEHFAKSRSTWNVLQSQAPNNQIWLFDYISVEIKTQAYRSYQIFSLMFWMRWIYTSKKKQRRNKINDSNSLWIRLVYGS